MTGTRTELVLALHIRPDPDLLAGLRWLMGAAHGDAPPSLPRELAAHPRAHGLLAGGGLAGPGAPPVLEPRHAESEEDAWVLQAWAAADHADDAAPFLQLLEWIEPHVEATDDAPEAFVGWYRVLGDAAPMLIHHDRDAKQLVLEPR